MRIGINTRFLLPHKMEGFGWYTYEITKRIAEQHPEHEFFFFFDRAYDPKFIFSKNVTPVVLGPQARRPILFKIWFNYSVKRAIKKYNIDLFFSPDGYLSLTTTVPQIGVIHDLNFEHFPEDLPKWASSYLKKYFPKFAQKANHIITVSHYSKQDICSTYHIPDEKVTAIWNGASNAFKPLSEEVKKRVRSTYSNQRNYIVFVGALHPRKNVRRLLEAYSQYINEIGVEHSLELVIVGTELWKNSSDYNIPSATAQKIHFTGHLPLNELTQVVAAADIFAFVPYFEGFGIPLVEAMKSGVPVLSGNKTSLPEVGGDAVLYCDPFDVSDIHAKLSLLASDAQLRSELIKKGLERGKSFSWDTSAEEVWNVIEQQLNALKKGY